VHRRPGGSHQRSFCSSGREKLLGGRDGQTREQNEATEWVKTAFDGDEFSNEQIAALVLGAWTFHDWGEVLSFSTSEMADRAQVNEEEAAGYTEALAIGFGEIDPRLRTGVDEARRHPLIPRRRRALPTLFSWQRALGAAATFRDLSEKAGTKAWRRYQTHRGRWVEKRAADLLGESSVPIY